MRRLNFRLLVLPTILCVTTPALADDPPPLVIRVRNTRQLGETTARLNDTVRSVRDTGKKVDCPKTGAEKVALTKPVEPPYEPKTVAVPTENGLTADISVVPKSMLAQIQAEVTGGDARPAVGWRNTCVCKERAHAVGEALGRTMKLETGKFMATAPWLGRIKPQLPGPGWTPMWEYHVANFIMVEEAPGAKPKPYVIDPGLLPNGPAPQAEWEAKLDGRSKTYVTNRYLLYPGERDNREITSYPSPYGKDIHNMRRNNERMFTQKDLKGCNRQL